MSEERVINKRLFGFAVGFFVILLLSFIFFRLDEKGMGIALILLALLQLVFITITPRLYVFSKERLIIKYFFGFEENISWQKVRAITQWNEEPGRFFWLGIYRIDYYSKEKQKFFMRGEVAKNRKTKKLFKKYCPQKYDW